MRNAHELLDTQIEWIERQLLAEKAAIHCPPEPENPDTKQLQWKGSIMELVELIYALHEAGCFGKASLKIMFAVIGKVFGCEITNYYRLFWDVRNRTGEDRAFFLNRLIKALSDRLVRMDTK